MKNQENNENKRNTAKKQKTDKATKKKERAFRAFPLKKTAAITYLSLAALLLSVVGICLASYRIYKSGVHGFYDCLQNPFLIAVCLFAICVVVALFIKSEYRVGKTQFSTCYGFVKTHLPLSEITAITYDPETGKLFFSIKDVEGQMTVTTAPNKLDELVKAVLEGNPSIDYSFTLRENAEEK